MRRAGERLPSPSIAFHRLPSPSTAFYRLPSPSVAFHRLLSPSLAVSQVGDLRQFLQSVVAGGPGRAAGDTSAARAARVESAVAEPPALERTELEAMSASKLKAYLRGRGVPTADCFERSDLLVRALETSGGSL